MSDQCCCICLETMTGTDVYYFPCGNACPPVHAQCVSDYAATIDAVPSLHVLPQCCDQPRDACIPVDDDGYASNAWLAAIFIYVPIYTYNSSMPELRCSALLQALGYEK